MHITTADRTKMTTIELNSSKAVVLESCKEKQRHTPTLCSRNQILDTTGPIRGIEEAIRKLTYWKGEVLDLEIFEGA